MTIFWFCIPAFGHTNPSIEVVRELTRRRHRVRYYSFADFREKIESAGATFISCDGYDFEMEDKENADRVGKDKVFATELLVSSTLALDEMTEFINSLGKEVVFLGDGVDAYRDEIVSKVKVPCVFAPAHLNRQNAASVAVLASEMYAEGKTVNADDHSPEYLRVSQAEREGAKNFDLT